jgi:hypothetical protein
MSTDQREAVARAICNSQPGRSYDQLTEFAKDWWRTSADAVLALPAAQAIPRCDDGADLFLSPAAQVADGWRELCWQLVAAWDALPGGHNYGASIIERWLTNDVGPAMQSARAKLLAAAPLIAEQREVKS